MANAFIAFLVALGIGTWSYTKANRQSGGANPKASMTVGLAVGITAFIVTFTLISALDNFLAN